MFKHDDIFLGRIPMRYFFSSSMPPVPQMKAAPTEEDESLKKAAEEAAAREKERLRKNRRPTLLTGIKGVQGESSVYQPQLIGQQAGNKRLG